MILLKLLIQLYVFFIGITTKAMDIGVCVKDMFYFVDLSTTDNLTKNY